MSQQERVSWVSLIVTVFFIVCYFTLLQGLPADADLFGGRLGRIISQGIGLLIVATVVGEAFARHAQRKVAGIANADATPIDERDLLIDLRAARNACWVLGLGVLAVIVQIGVLEAMQRKRDVDVATIHSDNMLEQLFTGPLTALQVAQLLVFVLLLSRTTVYGSRIIAYRRGF